MRCQSMSFFKKLVVYIKCALAIVLFTKLYTRCHITYTALIIFICNITQTKIYTAGHDFNCISVYCKRPPLNIVFIKLFILAVVGKRPLLNGVLINIVFFATVREKKRPLMIYFFCKIA